MTPNNQTNGFELTKLLNYKILNFFAIQKVPEFEQTEPRICYRRLCQLKLVCNAISKPIPSLVPGLFPRMFTYKFANFSSPIFGIKLHYLSAHPLAFLAFLSFLQSRCFSQKMDHFFSTLTFIYKLLLIIALFSTMLGSLLYWC